MSDTPARPRQVTAAAYAIMGGSVFVVLLVFQTIANLRSLETREAVEGFLDSPPGSGLGMSVSSVLSVMHVLGMVAAGCATAAAILGFYVLKRSKPARLALAVLALPLLISGMVTGGFLSSLVAACALLLWLPPARDWFAGREPAKPARPGQATTGPSAESVAAASGSVGPPATGRRPAPPQGARGEQDEPGEPGGEPRSMVGFGDPATHVSEPGMTGQKSATRRPAPVVGACVLTWAFAGFGVAAMALGLIYLALSPDSLLTEMRAQNPEVNQAGLSDQFIVATSLVMGGLFIAWGLGAMVLAGLFFRGVGWARLAMMLSTGVAMALVGLATLTQFVMIAPFFAAALTMAMLLRPEAKRWSQPKP